MTKSEYAALPLRERQSIGAKKRWAKVSKKKRSEQMKALRKLWDEKIPKEKKSEWAKKGWKAMKKVA